VTSPYRQNEAEKPSEPKSGELVYRPTERNDRFSGGRHGFKLFAPPCLLGLVVGGLVTEWAGVVAFAALLGFLIWWSRRRPENVVILRVTRGELAVIPMGSSREVFRARLDALDDVVLETKTVERVMETAAGAVNIGMGPLAPSVASATDTNRIALEPAEGAPHALTKDYFGHAESIEQFAKVRTFLRTMGWTPLSERGEGDDEEEDEEDEDALVRAAS
jgi:hypothetical protein